MLLNKKGDPIVLDNYRPIALMNNLLKLWTAIIKDSGSNYAEQNHAILTEEQNAFRLSRSIHDALPSIIMMKKDAKMCDNDIYRMYVNFVGAFNVDDHRIMLKHMRQLGMPSTLIDTCERLYGVSTTNYTTPYAPIPYLLSTPRSPTNSSGSNSTSPSHSQNEQPQSSLTHSPLPSQMVG
jgi:hypothetical protein